MVCQMVIRKKKPLIQRLFLFSSLFRLCFSIRPGASKAQRRIGFIGLFTPPSGHVNMRRTPASAPYNALFPGLWPSGIAEGRHAVISFVKPISTPLPHIARHIEQTFTRRAFGKSSHRHRAPVSSFSGICSRDVKTVSPGVKTALCPPRCAFPLCFSGQAFALP